jgi:hypothetical protein
VHLRLRQAPDGVVLQGIEAAVPVKSLATRMGLRDSHMRKHIFTTGDGQVPDLKFSADKAVCSKAAARQSTCELLGNLAIRGTARPFKVVLKVSEEGDTFRAVGDGTVTLSVWHRAAVATRGDDRGRRQAALRSHGEGRPARGRNDGCTMTRGRASATIVLGVAVMTLVGAPASALPTMIRLGYTDCASCHLAPQGGGPLNAYGRGIDAAQSLLGGDYQPSKDGRLMQDVRLIVQDQGTWSRDKPGLEFFRPRLMYRNVTSISKAFRISALGGGKTGSEIQTPMAIVILCGLTTSTLLNMFVVPTLYLRYARPAAQS